MNSNQTQQIVAPWEDEQFSHEVNLLSVKMQDDSEENVIADYFLSHTDELPDGINPQQMAAEVCKAAQLYEDAHQQFRANELRREFVLGLVDKLSHEDAVNQLIQMCALRESLELDDMEPSKIEGEAAAEDLQVEIENKVRQLIDTIKDELEGAPASEVIDTLVHRLIGNGQNVYVASPWIFVQEKAAAAAVAYVKLATRLRNMNGDAISRADVFTIQFLHSSQILNIQKKVESGELAKEEAEKAMEEEESLFAVLMGALLCCACSTISAAALLYAGFFAFWAGSSALVFIPTTLLAVACCITGINSLEFWKDRMNELVKAFKWIKNKFKRRGKAALKPTGVNKSRKTCS